MLHAGPRSAGEKDESMMTRFRFVFAALCCLTFGALFPSAAPVSAATKGIWLSPAEIKAKPMSGAAWTKLKAAADGALGTPKIADQESDHDVKTLAVALVYVRTGVASYRVKAANAIMAVVGTEAGGRTLALGRNLPNYVIAADLIDLQGYNASDDARFRAWLSGIRNTSLGGLTLISTHEQRPNNWGTYAGAARIAADVYLGDTADLARAAKVFQGWLGNRAAYSGFGAICRGRRIQASQWGSILPEPRRAATRSTERCPTTCAGAAASSGLPASPTMRGAQWAARCCRPSC
jgi:hypothetical protein